MVEQWLEAIEDLILAAAGNSDPTAGPVWASVLARLGEASAERVRAKRILWDFLETDDATQERPFFVLREYVLRAEKYAAGPALAFQGIVELAYTEPTLTEAGRAVEHKDAKRHFVTWTTELLADLVARAPACAVPIAAIEQVVFPQRTPLEQRDPDRPETDYFWAGWLIHIGERPVLRGLHAH